jgi:hypothetical protein
MINLITTLLILIISSSTLSSSAMGGYLLGMGARWQMSAFRPLDTEPTPNYFGYGLQLRGGYSFGETVDVALITGYTPSRPKVASAGKKTIHIAHYGGEIGFRFEEAVYIGIRGQNTYYELLEQTIDNEVEGVWRGAGGGLVLAAFTRKGQDDYYQCGIDITSSKLRRIDEAGTENRHLNTFGLHLSYAFIKFGGFQLKSIFNTGFLKSFTL